MAKYFHTTRILPWKSPLDFHVTLLIEFDQRLTLVKVLAISLWMQWSETDLQFTQSHLVKLTQLDKFNVLSFLQSQWPKGNLPLNISPLVHLLPSFFLFSLNSHFTNSNRNPLFVVQYKFHFDIIMQRQISIANFPKIIQLNFSPSCNFTSSSSSSSPSPLRSLQLIVF